MHGVRITLRWLERLTEDKIKTMRKCLLCFPVTHSVLFCLTITASYTLTHYSDLFNFTITLTATHTHREEELKKRKKKKSGKENPDLKSQSRERNKHRVWNDLSPRFSLYNNRLLLRPAFSLRLQLFFV